MVNHCKQHIIDYLDSADNSLLLKPWFYPKDDGAGFQAFIVLFPLR